MADIGIAITKSCAFRDSVQEFTNTYFYGSVGLLPNESQALALIDELVANEKTFHSTAVTFVRAKLWSAGGSPAANHMIAQKDLSGTGSTSLSTSLDRERAYLIQWPAGLDVRGHKVYLKKWYHSCGFFAAHTLGASILANQTGFTTTERAAIAAAADVVTRLGTIPEEWGLKAESGRERDGDGPFAHQYLEHHQLGDMWRA